MASEGWKTGNLQTLNAFLYIAQKSWKVVSREYKYTNREVEFPPERPSFGLGFVYTKEKTKPKPKSPKNSRLDIYPLTTSNAWCAWSPPPSTPLEPPSTLLDRTAVRARGVFSAPPLKLARKAAAHVGNG